MRKRYIAIAIWSLTFPFFVIAATGIPFAPHAEAAPLAPKVAAPGAIPLLPEGGSINLLFTVSNPNVMGITIMGVSAQFNNVAIVAPDPTDKLSATKLVVGGNCPGLPFGLGVNMACTENVLVTANPTDNVPENTDTGVNTVTFSAVTNAGGVGSTDAKVTVADVPEPSSFLLLAVGVAGAICLRRSRQVG